jgi:hypothetical protein
VALSLPRRLTAWLAVGLLTTGLLAGGTTPADAATKRPTSVTLTPTADPAHSQSFTWRMTRKRSGQVVQIKAPDGRVSTAAARYKMRVQKKYSGINAYAFTATATKLAPGTRYAYRIVTSGGSTSWTGFTTARTGLDRPWTFLAFGDTQVDNTGVPETLIDTAVAANPTAPLLLHAGDVVNKPSSITEWRQFMTATYPTRTNRNWLIAVGNHEQCVLLKKGCRSGDAQAFRSYYSWPRNGYAGQGETWYYTDYQGVRFIVLDTFGGDLQQQSAFLETALKTNRQRWTVVLEHAGPFASRSDRDNAAVRSRLLPLFERYQVDLVLSGHDHSYNRGYDGNRNSTVYAVSDSGPKFYEPSGRDWQRAGATRVVTAGHTSTYQRVTVSQNTLTYQAVVGYKGKGSTTAKKVGQVLDQVTITKSGRTKTVR